MNVVQEAMANIQIFISKEMSALNNTLKKAGLVDNIEDLLNSTTVKGYVPSKLVVKPGLYDSCDGKTHVEVLKQDLELGLVHVQIYDEDDPYKKFDFISTGMFVRLFQPKSPISYITGNNSSP